MSLSPIENIWPSSALSTHGNFYIKFQAPLMNLNAGHQIRMTKLFPHTYQNRSLLHEDSGAKSQALAKINSRLIDSFVLLHQELLLLCWLEKYEFARESERNENFEPFYKSLVANVANFETVDLEFGLHTSLTAPTRMNYWFCMNEAYYMLFSDLHLTDLKDKMRFKYLDFNVRDRNAIIQNKIAENRRFRELLNRVISINRYPDPEVLYHRFPGKKYYREYTIFGDHWIDSVKDHPLVSKVPERGFLDDEVLIESLEIIIEGNLLDRTAEAYYIVKKCFAGFDTIVRQTGIDYG
ncbi:hypothetical protein WICPIJ_005591 [Wickerhamomyces pijperi]|uniref:Uncharacterized protein n=1 Tax=Wickerhamomyces pijperi TaxID=599730 RepID=A0A9P8TLS8_WICPI|nr:hypothetical protein WICPIJ_005591 [Wickerhamomyces pijperi]